MPQGKLSSTFSGVLSHEGLKPILFGVVLAILLAQPHLVLRKVGIARDVRQQRTLVGPCAEHQLFERPAVRRCELNAVGFEQHPQPRAAELELSLQSVSHGLR